MATPSEGGNPILARKFLTGKSLSRESAVILLISTEPSSAQRPYALRGDSNGMGRNSPAGDNRKDQVSSLCKIAHFSKRVGPPPLRGAWGGQFHLNLVIALKPFNVSP